MQMVVKTLIVKDLIDDFFMQPFLLIVNAKVPCRKSFKKYHHYIVRIGHPMRVFYHGRLCEIDSDLLKFYLFIGSMVSVFSKTITRLVNIERNIQKCFLQSRNTKLSDPGKSTKICCPGLTIRSLNSSSLGVITNLQRG